MRGKIVFALTFGILAWSTVSYAHSPHGPKHLDWSMIWLAIFIISAIVGILARSSAPTPAAATSSRGGGLVAVLALGLGIGAIAVLSDQAKTAAPATAAPKTTPTTRTVIIHDTVTKVVQTGSHLNGVEMTILGVVALGVCCAIYWMLRPESS